MAEREIFPKAPITEALLDIRVSSSDTVNLDQLVAFQDCVRDRYPNKRDRKLWKGSLQFGTDGPQLSDKTGGTDGYFFSSSDGKNIVQCRLDGFTFNRLKPYDRWETFRDEALHLWEFYKAIAQPTQIIRVALRYINRIEIPVPFRDFKDYVLTGPEIAPGLPQGLAGFFLQLRLPAADAATQIVVTETMEPITETRRLPFILDIDVFREAAYDIDEPASWEMLDELHDLKNDVFFKSITAKARELFR